MNILNTISISEKIGVYIKVNNSFMWIELDKDQDMDIECQDNINMIYIKLDPILYSKIGIKAEKFVEYDFSADNIPFLKTFNPDICYYAKLTDREIIIAFKTNKEIEKNKQKIHDEVNNILKE